MIDEVKVDKLEELVDAIVAKGGIPTIGSSDNGKALKAVVPAEGDPYAAWVAESSASYKINTETAQMIGQYEEVNTSTQEVSVYPIKTKYIPVSYSWGYTNNYGPSFALANVHKILSVTVLGTWTYGDAMEKVNVFYDPTETVWKTYRTGNALSDMSVSAVIVEYAETVV